MQIVSFEAAQATRYRVEMDNGVRTWISPYLGKHSVRGESSDTPAGVLYPVAYLVEQDPHTDIPAHFHNPDQFQIFTSGSGTIGRHSIKPVMVQYAPGGATYGPIKSGGGGLSYLTLRNGWDPGARWMPESRSELATLGPLKRSIYAERIELTDGTGVESATTRHAIEETDVGLSVAHYALPAGSYLKGPDPSSGRGQFWIVGGGDGKADGAPIAPMACVFVSPAEASTRFTAGGGGLDLILAQFPR